MTATRAMCTFVLDGKLFGVGVEWVQEVLRPQPVTRLPLAGPTVRGLINLRGQIVPAVELRRCLGLPERPPGVVWRPSRYESTTAFRVSPSA